MFKFKGLARENKRLKKKLDYAQTKIADHEKELVFRHKRLTILEEQKEEFHDKWLTTQKKLRDQTEADLLLSTIKLIVTLIRNEKPSEEDLEKHRMLHNQLAQMQGPRYYQPLFPSGVAGILGGIF